MRGVRQPWAVIAGVGGVVGIAVAGASGPALGAAAGASGVPSAPQVMAQAVKALASAPAFTLSGYVVQGTSRYGIDLRSKAKGAEASGSLFLGSTKPGVPAQSFSFIELGSKVYLKANPLFWTKEAGSLPAPVLKVIGAHWIVMSGASAKGITSSFASFTDAAGLAKEIFGGSGIDAVRFGPVTTSHGVRVRALVDASQSATMYVPATGAPLPLEIVGKKARNGGDLTFGYPASLTITAPAGAVTIEQLVLSALKG